MHLKASIEGLDAIEKAAPTNFSIKETVTAQLFKVGGPIVSSASPESDSSSSVYGFLPGYQHFIGGRRLAGETVKKIELRNPAAARF